MLNFKAFLMKESSEYTIYKPQTGGRYTLGWGSREDWANVYSLPASPIDVRKSMEESGSVRMIIDKKGNVHMWNGGILHDVVLFQIKDIKSYANLFYNMRDSEVYFDSPDGSIVNIKDVLKDIQENPKTFQKAFDKIKSTLPMVRWIQVGDNNEKISIDEPYKYLKN